MVDGVVDKVLLRKFCGGFILWVESESWAGLGWVVSLQFMNFLYFSNYFEQYLIQDKNYAPQRTYIKWP